MKNQPSMYGYPENPDAYDEAPSGAVAFFVVMVVAAASGFCLGYMGGVWGVFQ